MGNNRSQARRWQFALHGTGTHMCVPAVSCAVSHNYIPQTDLETDSLTASHSSHKATDPEGVGGHG